MEIHTCYLPEPVATEQDTHGRHFITHHGKRYLVPFKAVVPDMDPCREWHFHPRVRLAAPGALCRHAIEHPPYTRFKGPEDYEGGETIFLIGAESKTAAVFIAACCGLHVFGWDVSNPSGRDCSGQTFSSGATIFLMCRDSSEPRARFATYGFHVSWGRDI